MTHITLTRAELKTKKGTDFQEGDVISVGKYDIHIEYGEYKKPTMKTWVWDTSANKKVSCWPAGVRGCWPYFIADFLHRDTPLEGMGN